MRKGLLAWTFLALAPVAAGAAEGKKECCFANLAYSGVCRVTPAEGETCSSILHYLNTPNSVGKNYCTSTAIRGEWKKRSCDAKPKEGTAAGQRSREGRPASPTPAEPIPGH